MGENTAREIEIAEHYEAICAAKDREIEELGQQLKEATVAQARAEQSRDMTQSLLDEWRQAAPQRDEAIRHLGELLAVIHRDGGHYQAEHGAAKAAEDAMSKLSSLWCELYDLRGEYEETAALFGAWKQRAEQAESERDEARAALAAEIAQTTVALARYAAAHDQAERERDEARECVKRLYLALHASVTDAGRWAHLDWIEALAATPEHLRNG